MAHAVLLRRGVEPYPGYHLQQLIGSGGFAEVWVANTTDDRRVALKFLPSSNGRAIREEIRALQAIRELEHPNLIQIEQIWCHLGYIVVAMELADGSLRDLLELCQKDWGTPLMPDLVCHFLTQAALAIDFLNQPRPIRLGKRESIHHCDIKPSNLLVIGDTLKVADFGLASLRRSQPNQPSSGGTPAYAAPEVHQGRVTAYTDQFALAVTYCELRGGRLPYPHPPPKFSRDFVPPPPDLSMLTPKELPIIARALSPLPPDRWPSCHEMMDRLGQATC